MKRETNYPHMCESFPKLLLFSPSLRTQKIRTKKENIYSLLEFSVCYAMCSRVKEISSSFPFSFEEKMWKASTSFIDAKTQKDGKKMITTFLWRWKNILLKFVIFSCLKITEMKVKYRENSRNFQYEFMLMYMKPHKNVYKQFFLSADFYWILYEL